MSYLADYATAEQVVTPLLHCYLPCRALQTDVTFLSRNRSTDPRFEGLIGISEEDRQELVGKMRRNAELVVSSVLAGHDEVEIRRRWREANIDRVREIERRMAARAEKDEGTRKTPPAMQIDTKLRKVLDGTVRDSAIEHRDGVVEIALCYDEQLMRPVYATIRSVLSNSSSEVRFTLLTRGVDDVEIRRLSAAFPQVEFVWADMSDVGFGDLHLLKHTSVSTMDRIFLTELATYTDRIIYLDVDIALVGDITELFARDMGGHPVAARTSLDRGWRRGFGLARKIESNLDASGVKAFRRDFVYARPMNFTCFNAGMLLLDLAALRGMDAYRKLLSVIDAYGINDQFALNLVIAGNYLELERCWNCLVPQESCEDAKLLHFVGQVKPWDLEYTRRCEDLRKHMDPSDGSYRSASVDRDWFSNKVS